MIVSLRLNQSHFTRAWPLWPNRTTSTTGDLPTCNTTIGWCSERMGDYTDVNFLPSENLFGFS